MKRSKTFAFRINDPAIAEQIEQDAKELKTSESAILRRIVRNHYGKPAKTSSGLLGPSLPQETLSTEQDETPEE